MSRRKDAARTPPGRRAGLAFMVLGLCTAPVWAHALGVVCRLLEDKVHVEAFYGDNSPAANALVSIRNREGNLVVEGRTTELGYCVFDRPKTGRYEVVVDAGQGHRARTTMRVDDSTSVGQISDGPNREAFTQVPWLKIVLALVALLGFGVGIRFAMRKAAPPPNETLP